MKRLCLIMSHLVFATALCVSTSAALASADAANQDLPVLEQWGGDFPVDKLDLLPEGQRDTSTGFLGDERDFAPIWEIFKPGEAMPVIDFSQNLILFFRNTDFYNKVQIFKVQFSDGLVRVMAMESMSAMPVEDKVAMALAVVPRAGITAVLAGEKEIPVALHTDTIKDNHSGSDPINTAYILEGQAIQLVDGHASQQAVPGSASVATTSVFGQPIYGDLEGDHPAEAALFLVHMPGGSGTFYYVAAARQVHDSWQGSNAVLIGDRISPKSIEIRDKHLIVNYADRRFGEAMATPPALAKSKYLAMSEGRLTEIPANME